MKPRHEVLEFKASLGYLIRNNVSKEEKKKERERKKPAVYYSLEVS